MGGISGQGRYSTVVYNKVRQGIVELYHGRNKEGTVQNLQYSWTKNRKIFPNKKGTVQYRDEKTSFVGTSPDQGRSS